MMNDQNIAEIKRDCDGRWVGDGRKQFEVGDYSFLIEIYPFQGRPRLEVRFDPVRIAGSLDDILYGFVEGPRTDIEALGVAKIMAVTKSSGRAQIETVWGKEMDIALLELGYPEIPREVYFTKMGAKDWVREGRDAA